MIDAFNKATKKFTDFFIYIEKEIDFNQKTIHDSLIKLSNNVFLWQYDSSYEDEEYVEIFQMIFKCNYLIFNTTPRQLSFKKEIHISKIKDIKSPDYPSYTLNYLISFCISAQNWLNENQSNIIIIHNDLNDGKVLCLLSALLSFISIVSFHPTNAYANILLKQNKTIREFSQKSESKNHMRYMNYLSTVQSNPIIQMKKIFLKSILINSAPAIDNSSNTVFSPYITINVNSFYSPVIRIISNGSVVYCSYSKHKPVDKVFYSPDNCIIFNINLLIFSDTIIEVLHKGDNRFKQLFSIQFHSLFITEDAIRFTRDQIDGVCKDIRYPNDFFIDLLFDQTKDVSLSQYDEEIIKFKSLISEYILKSYKPSEKQKIISSSITLEKEDRKQIVEVKPLKNEPIVNQVQKMFSTMDINDDKLTKDEGDEDDDEENIENYLKNLENKTK